MSISQRTLGELINSDLPKKDIEELVRFIDRTGVSESYATILTQSLLLTGSFAELEDLMTTRGMGNSLSEDTNMCNKNNGLTMEEFVNRHSSKRLVYINTNIAYYKLLKKLYNTEIEEMLTTKLACALSLGRRVLPLIKELLMDNSYTCEDIYDFVELTKLTGGEVDRDKFLALPRYTRKAVHNQIAATGCDLDNAILERKRDNFANLMKESKDPLTNSDYVDFLESQAMAYSIKDFPSRKRLVMMALQRGVFVLDVDWADPLYADIDDLLRVLKGLISGLSKRELKFFYLYSETLSEDQLNQALDKIKEGYDVNDLAFIFDREPRLAF